MPVKALVTDLDGTLIPLAAHRGNEEDLAQLQQTLNDHRLLLVYATGRHPASVCQAITEFGLPQPNWAICDTGTTMLENDGTGILRLVASYHEHLSERVNGFAVDQLYELETFLDGAQLQESEKQGRFKLCFYTDSELLDDITATLDRLLQARGIPWSFISCIDPITGGGLIDILPDGVTKASAVSWWASAQQLSTEEIVYAGDSGNDLAALSAGHLTVTVGNAQLSVVETVRRAHADAGWTNRHHHSEHPGTSGVLEGLRRFLDDHSD